MTDTTKQELSQLYWLKKEIAGERERLRTWERAARGETGPLPGLPPLAGDARGAALLKRRQAWEAAQLRRLVAEYDRLTQYIFSVKDSWMRQILTRRYVDGMSWVQVAARLGGGNTADGVRKAHDRFLRSSVSSGSPVVPSDSERQGGRQQEGDGADLPQRAAIASPM